MDTILKGGKNMIFKNILGVHSKASNLAIQTELGYYLICIKSYKLMLKYYSSLVDIESSCDSKFNLLRATFIEDKNLYNNKHPSWVQTVFQLEKIMLNVKFTDTSYFDFKQLIEHLYKNTLLCQLEHMKLNVPVSIASWWALILILIMRDLLNLGRSKLRYCFKSNDVQILL
jgi:hypothetical protein